MAGLLEKILEDIKSAMKSRDSARLEVLRTLHSDIKNVSINSNRPIDDTVVLDVLSRSIKQHSDSLEQFRAGGRADLVSAEEQKLTLFRSYLPRQMEESEIVNLVAEIVQKVNATTPADMGKVMKELQPLVKGKADGKLVSALVSAALRK